MPEYTYLLETRLSAAQKNALAQVRDAAREAGMVVFLAGGAVRDLTTGSSVRDLDFAVQGNALDLLKALEARGATLWGRHEPSRSLFLWFPGSVRVEVSSTRTEAFPKPGKPVYTWSGIVDDLYRRDFTVNAMALSLNEGSYGLLLDPLNGVADTEARQLRLVSNYGFIEDPSRLLRAMRLSRRMGWAMEERTEARYQNAKEADNFEDISDFHRGYELEEIAIEEDALSTLKAYEAEGWMQKLFPDWSSSQADTAALDNLHRARIQLLMQGIAPDLTAAHLELLTAKMKPEWKTALKQRMVRTGLIAAWESLDTAAKDFAKLLTGKEMAVPSAAWKLFHSHAAEPVLWLAYTGKGAAETKFKQMFTVWPEVAKKVPVTMMSELRITPELPVYEELLHELFLQQIDGKLETDEQMRAFLETYSPPAPPPPVSVKRTRAKKSAAKGKRKGAEREPEIDPEDEPAHEDHDDDEGPDEERDREADHDTDDDDQDAAEEDLPKGPPSRMKKTVETAAPVKSETVKKVPPVMPEPVKKAALSKAEAASARDKASASDVNLEGVDLSAMLERIQGTAASKKSPAKSTTKPAAAEKQGTPAPSAKAAPGTTPPLKAAAKPDPAKATHSVTAKTKSAANSAPVNAKKPVPAKPAVKSDASAKSAKPAGKHLAVTKSAAKVPAKHAPTKTVAKPAVNVSRSVKNPIHEPPTPGKKSSQAKAAPVQAKKKTAPATPAHKKAAPAKTATAKAGHGKPHVQAPAKRQAKPIAKKPAKR
jgi:tRNA nucleotidyltransferase (CCA-adding enzyme)